MAINTQLELVKALEFGDFDDILGTPEMPWLDFKQKAYDGTTNSLSRKGRYELCKDAAAFANHKGGIILLGVSEKLSEVNGLSVADKITPLKINSVNLAHYKSILMSHVYPLLSFEINWYSNSEGKGLLAITIAKRNGGLHIVKDTVEENGNGLHGLNIPLRQGDQTYLYTAEALYELMHYKQQSVINTSIEARRNNNAEIRKVMQDQISHVHNTGKSIRNNLISSLDWDELPVMVVQAVAVSGPDRLESFFDKVAADFRDTKPVRNMGFNLNSFGYESSTTDGAYIKSGVRDIALRLDSDGTTTMAMRGNQEFLGWAVNKEPDSGKVRINSIVLVEVIYEFTRFIHETLTKYGLSNWQYNLDVRRFKEYKVCLNPGGPNSLFGTELNIASTDNWVKTIGKDKEQGVDAYKILTEIYALFMLSEKVIPFVNHESSSVTKETILGINSNINGY